MDNDNIKQYFDMDKLNKLTKEHQTNPIIKQYKDSIFELHYNITIYSSIIETLAEDPTNIAKFRDELTNVNTIIKNTQTSLAGYYIKIIMMGCDITHFHKNIMEYCLFVKEDIQNILSH